MASDGIAPMVTSMKSPHGSVLFKHSVVRSYSSFVLDIVSTVLSWRNNPSACFILALTTHGLAP